MKPFFGDRLDPGSVGSRQVVAIPASRLAAPPIQVRRWVRPGLVPNAELESKKHEAANQAAIWRTKDYFSMGRLRRAPLTASDDVWRWAFRSGPFAHAMFCSVVLGPPQTPFQASNSYAQVNLYSDATESTLATSETFHYGPRPNVGSTINGWDYLRAFDKLITITPNTDYYALLRGIDYARIYSVTAFELASMTENFNGYLPQNIGAQGPILDVYREKQRQLAKQVWQDGPPRVFTWSTDPGNGFGSGQGPSPFTYKVESTGTLTNILDLTSTTVTANTPGWHPDMRHKATLRQTSGVPCVMKAFGRISPGPGTGGDLRLLDSGGNTVAQISNAWSTTAAWESVTFNLPATHAKYDVHFAGTGGQSFHLGAVSVYELG